LSFPFKGYFLFFLILSAAATASWLHRGSHRLSLHAFRQCAACAKHRLLMPRPISSLRCPVLCASLLLILFSAYTAQARFRASLTTTIPCTHNPPQPIGLLLKNRKRVAHLSLPPPPPLLQSERRRLSVLQLICIVKVKHRLRRARLVTTYWSLFFFYWWTVCCTL
jgi:hypothetical protein